VAVLAAALAAAVATPPSAATTPQKEETATMRAAGTFEVKVTPVPETTDAPGAFPRHSLAKRFHGDLDGTSEGVMMSVGATTEGSGAYVALERVTATLAGRKGTFSLVHRGTMRGGGDFRLAVDVVPDSGAGELAGLSGTMEIEIEGREHRYVLHYNLPDAAR
jgi:hypothetical protein